MEEFWYWISIERGHKFRGFDCEDYTALSTYERTGHLKKLSFDETSNEKCLNSVAIAAGLEQRSYNSK